jgi:hypothetical protein
MHYDNSKLALSACRPLPNQFNITSERNWEIASEPLFDADWVSSDLGSCHPYNWIVIWFERWDQVAVTIKTVVSAIYKGSARMLGPSTWRFRALAEFKIR